MTTTVEFHGLIAIIILSGNIDYSTQDEIRDAINKTLSSNEVNEIHVNLADVTFMDSSGIRALMNLQKIADKRRKALVLKNCSRSILQVFEIGGFDQMFTIL
jgi:anti-anti-sigma factor